MTSALVDPRNHETSAEEKYRKNWKNDRIQPFCVENRDMRIEPKDVALNRYTPCDWLAKFARCRGAYGSQRPFAAQHGARDSIQSATTECAIHRSTPWNYQQNTLSRLHACPWGCLWKVRKVCGISWRRTSPERGVQQETHLVHLKSAHSGFDIVAFLMQKTNANGISRHFKAANNI